jgi:gliding motility-associated-like protein
LFGCEDNKTIYVTITNDFQVYIPNSFTPNGDGLNDVFKPEMEGKEFIKQYKFTVFNRWGEVIFETEDPSRAWLGDAKGSDFYTESDTYSYRLVIEVEQSAETKVYQGLVSVIK